ncbi:MAG: hypothetical protein U0Q22_10945 [Acidimicrobiales bacterium]
MEEAATPDLAVPDLPAPDLAAPDLAALIERIRPTVLSAERTLPVPGALQGVFPLGGLARGSRLSLRGTGAASICMATVAEASRSGSWVAVVGVGAWGWAAAARAGWALERSVFVVEPPTSQWGTVVAALVDAVDVVIVDPSHQVTAADARRLAARSRERGAVVVDVTLDDGRRRFRWPTEPDLELTVESVSWSGLDVGHGSLSERVLRVSAVGRRGAARQRRVDAVMDARGSLTLREPGAASGPMTAAPAGRHLRSVG